MGKYEFKKSYYDIFILNSKELLLCRIANELAETNRLKRLEIKIVIEGVGIIDQDSLEDQA